MCPSQSQDDRLISLAETIRNKHGLKWPPSDLPGIRAPLLCCETDFDSTRTWTGQEERITEVATTALEMMQSPGYDDALWKIFRDTTKYIPRDKKDIDQTLLKIFEPWALDISNLPPKDVSQSLKKQVEEDNEALHFGGRWEVIAAMILEWGRWESGLFDDDPVTKVRIEDALKVCYPLDLNADGLDRGGSSDRLAKITLDSISEWKATCRGTIIDISENGFHIFDIPCLQKYHNEFHSLILIPQSHSKKIKPGDSTTIEIPGSHLRRNRKAPFPLPLDTPSANIGVV